MDVEEAGFQHAMEEHRLASGAGEAFGPMGGEDAEIYRRASGKLEIEGKLDFAGVSYNPYENRVTEGEVLALSHEGQVVPQVQLVIR